MDQTEPAPAPLTDAERELEQVRERRAKLAEAREARATPSAEQQLAVEKRDLRDDEALERLELEIGRVGVEIQIVRSPNVGGVIVKRPHLAVWRRFQGTLNKDSDDPQADELVLVRPCVLHPSKDEFDEMLKREPFLLSRCASAVSELAGVRREKVAKKY